MAKPKYSTPIATHLRWNAQRISDKFDFKQDSLLELAANKKRNEFDAVYEVFIFTPQLRKAARAAQKTRYPGWLPVIRIMMLILIVLLYL